MIKHLLTIISFPHSLLSTSTGTRVDLLFHSSVVVLLQKLLDRVAENSGAWHKLQKDGTTHDPSNVYIYMILLYDPYYL